MTARVRLALGVSLVLAAAPAGAQDDYRYGRIRTVEPGVVLQRASEASAESAVSNMPFLPGDRVWTDEGGRLEIQFTDGSVLRLDSRSKLDYVEHDGGRRAERAVLRLWSGALILHYRSLRRSPDFVIETPEGVLEPQARGVYRFDVSPGEARVAVLDGEATVDAGRRVQLSRGEGVLIREGEVYAGPERFNAYDADDEFARWDARLQEQLAYAERRQEWLPEEVSPYAAEFDTYGRWQAHPEYGHVWYPHVDYGWQPYTHGHWAWTAFGWTWIPNERWGWAPFHYGRWGFGHGLGWYWIPGRSWGPAWVSWAVGGNYVGWCPLGWGDRLVVIHERGRRVRQPKGFAVPRGSGALEASTISTPWFYVRRGDLGARDLARRRVPSDALPTADLRVAPSPRARLSRDLRILDPGTGIAERAVPRTVRARPGPGDTVQELRSDPMTTIPHPVPRRRREREPSEADQERERAGSRVAVPRAPAPAPWNSQANAPPRAQPSAPEAAPEAGQWRERFRPRPRPGEELERGARDREVLRPLFRPLSRPREESGAVGRPDANEGRYARPRSDAPAPRSWSGPPRSRGDEGRSAPDRPSAGSHRPERGSAGVSRPSGGAAPRQQSAAPAPRAQGERARSRDRNN